MSEYQVVKYKCGKNTFEVLCKMGTAQKYRDGKLGINNVLVSDDVFLGHYQKGDRPSPSDLVAAFKSSDMAVCAKYILDHGEINLSQDERKEKVEQRRKEIVNYIHKYYIDPKTKTPHPVTRIENALTTLKVHPDPDKDFDREMQDIVKLLPGILTIKRCEVEATLSVQSAFMGAAEGIVRKHAKVNREKYSGADCIMEISLLPGDYDALVADLSRVTKGNFTIDIVGAPGESPAKSTSPAAAAAGGKGKKGGKGAGPKGKGRK